MERLYFGLPWRKSLQSQCVKSLKLFPSPSPNWSLKNTSSRALWATASPCSDTTWESFTRLAFPVGTGSHSGTSPCNCVYWEIHHSGKVKSYLLSQKTGVRKSNKNKNKKTIRATWSVSLFSSALSGHSCRCCLGYAMNKFSQIPTGVLVWIGSLLLWHPFVLLYQNAPLSLASSANLLKVHLISLSMSFIDKDISSFIKSL